MDAHAMFLDESLGNDVLTVGGFIAPVEDLPNIEHLWRALKTDTFGLPSGAELKFTFPNNHPTRTSLDSAGFTHAVRVPLMLATIESMPVALVANTQVDYRRNTEPRDFYLDSLKWCLRRLANHVPHGSRTHWVVVDMPSPPADVLARELSDRLRDLHERVGTAAFDVYADMYWEGEQFTARGLTGQPLRESGFAPTLVAAHAKHSDLLQVADVVTGCVREFCTYNLKYATPAGHLPQPDYQQENLVRIAPRFRSSWEGKVIGVGFDLFPPRHPACGAVKSRVEALCSS